MKTKIFLLLLALWGLAAAAGLIDRYAAGESLNRPQLAAARKQNLIASAKGPLKAVHLRYRDQWKGKSRTFVWSSESYQLVDGATSYVMVLVEASGKKVRYLTSAATSTLRCNLGGDEESAYYSSVYDALDGYIDQHKLVQELKP